MAFQEPDERESKILKRNLMDPGEFSVILSGEDFIILKMHKSGDTIRIERGDKPWK